MTVALDGSEAAKHVMLVENHPVDAKDRCRSLQMRVPPGWKTKLAISRW